jgi:two-component system nitrogen regulation response regulator GlnG
LAKEDNHNKTENWGEILESWILKEFNSDSENISEKINNVYESILIKSALKLSGGNKTEAAKILGWGRNTITNKMKSIKN